MGVNWRLEEVECQLQAEVAKRDEAEGWRLVMEVLKRGAPDVDKEDEVALPTYRGNTNPQFKELIRPKEDQMAITVDEKKRAKKRKLEKMLEDIAKSASGVEAVEAVSKQELADAVVAKARARAAKNGTTVEKEESAIWREIYSRPMPQLDYDSRILKYSTPKAGTTQAEIALDGLAKTTMKRDGTSFAQAYNTVLKSEQGQKLYADYVREYNEGSTSEVPVPEEYRASGFLSRAEEAEIRKRRAAKDDPGGNSLRLRRQPDDLGDEDAEDEDDGDDGEDGGDDNEIGGDRQKRLRKVDLSALRCEQCSTVNSADSSFCKQCGTRLS
jgi:hypothetical protein